MRFGQVRIEFDRLLKRLNRFLVLVVAVELLALSSRYARAGAVSSGKSLDTAAGFSTIIRALLTAAIAANGQRPADTRRRLRESISSSIKTCHC